MLTERRFRRSALLVLALATLVCNGCTSFSDYIHNGFKVGPNYCPPAAPVAKQWIDANDVRVRKQNDDLCQWWAIFNDPILDHLMRTAYSQNLTLKEAGYRVLEARAQLAIARGEFFPQLQDATGSYRRSEISLNPPNSGAVGVNRFSSQWNAGFNLAWELDFWGRFRRAIASADDLLQSSVFNYDDVLVTLLGDIATNYIQIRTDQKRIQLLEETLKFQEDVVLRLVQDKFRVGVKGTSALDVEQAKANVAQTRAQIPQLRVDLRQANNRLCTLLGIPTIDLQDPPEAGGLSIGTQPIIPSTPPDLAVGMPADLLRRRPNVRRAERDAAAQAEQIGIAQAQLYPAFTINGSVGWQAKDFAHLFSSQALTQSVGPSFQWDLLNYGRIVNNVRLQDARFGELVVIFQQTVLQADEEVENGIVTFLQGWERKRRLDESVIATRNARGLAIAFYEKGLAGVPGVSVVPDFNRYSVLEQNLIQQQDQWAQAQGEIAQGLVQVYRALGGGWQIRLMPEAAQAARPVMPRPAPTEVIPAPAEGVMMPQSSVPLPPELPPMPPARDNSP